MSLGVVLIGQFLEGNILSPKLVGDSVGLHPVWLIFALLAFGSLFGFTGLITAVPVCRRRRSNLAFRGQALPRKQSLYEHGWFRPSDSSRIQRCRIPMTEDH